jgi:hypothetical protein
MPARSGQHWCQDIDGEDGARQMTQGRAAGLAIGTMLAASRLVGRSRAASGPGQQWRGPCGARQAAYGPASGAGKAGRMAPGANGASRGGAEGGGVGPNFFAK